VRQEEKEDRGLEVQPEQQGEELHPESEQLRIQVVQRASQVQELHLDHKLTANVPPVQLSCLQAFRQSREAVP
jgi:hypothetical protein